MKICMQILCFFLLLTLYKCAVITGVPRSTNSIAITLYNQELNEKCTRPVKEICSVEVGHVVLSACGFVGFVCALHWGVREMSATLLAIRSLSLENGNITPVLVCQTSCVLNSLMVDTDAQ